MKLFAQRAAIDGVINVLKEGIDGDICAVEIIRALARGVFKWKFDEIVLWDDEDE